MDPTPGRREGLSAREMAVVQQDVQKTSLAGEGRPCWQRAGWENQGGLCVGWGRAACQPGDLTPAQS